MLIADTSTPEHYFPVNTLCATPFNRPEKVKSVYDVCRYNLYIVYVWLDITEGILLWLSSLKTVSYIYDNLE